MKQIDTSTLSFYYKTPKNSNGKTVFFFALSASDSLTLAPFCHPVDRLLENGVTVVSTTLPFHENNEKPYSIAKIWSENSPILDKFLKDLTSSMKELKETFPPPYGASGISRGGFIALYLASLLEEVKAVSAFAPLLSIPNHDHLNLTKNPKALFSKNLHFFVGNNDAAIDTKKVLEFCSELSDQAREQKQKNIEIYAKMFPSIGRHGHGTSDPIFNEGVSWLTNQL